MMWEYVDLPQGDGGAEQRETLIRQFTEEKMRAYDGTVFFCISRADRERRLTFRQAAQAVGCSARDGRAVAAASWAQTLAEQAGRDVLFVEPAMQSYLGEYLDACPPGARHVLFYCRRKMNGPSPRMSLFMDFWVERGVEIWDFRNL